jgi:uridine kinase
MVGWSSRFSSPPCRSETRLIQPADVVVIEGILVLHMEEIRDMLNMKVYVDTDDDVRLARR